MKSLLLLCCELPVWLLGGLVLMPTDAPTPLPLPTVSTEVTPSWLTHRGSGRHSPERPNSSTQPTVPSDPPPQLPVHSPTPTVSQKKPSAAEESPPAAPASSWWRSQHAANSPDANAVSTDENRASADAQDSKTGTDRETGSQR